MKTEHKVIAISVMFGLLVWIVDALMDYLIFYEGTLLGLLITDVPYHELYIRSIVISCFLIFGIVISMIITKHKKIDNALQESEEKYRSLFEGKSDAVMVFDAENHQFENANQATLDLFGYTAKEFLSLKVSDISAEKDKTEKTVQKLKDGSFENKIIASCKMIKKDGTIFDAEISTSTYFSKGRKKIIGAVRDVTARKKTERELENVFNLSPEMICVCTPEGGFIKVSPSCKQILGYTPDEILELGWAKLVHPDDANNTNTEVDKQTRSEHVMNFINRFRCKDGLYKTLEWQATPVIDGLVYATARDITERKKSEEEVLLQSEIIKNMSEGVYLIRLNNGIIVYTNPKFEQIFGYAPGEMLGKHVSIVNAPTKRPHEETANEIMGIMEKTGVWQGEIENIKKDGSTFWCHASISKFDHPEFGEVLVTVHTDITERKKAERKIESISKFPSENPNPVLRINSNNEIIYMNEAVHLQLIELGLTEKDIFKILPANTDIFIEKALNENLPTHLVEVNVANKVYSYNIVPVADQKYVNLYGRDITKRIQAEKKLENAYLKLKDTQKQLIQSSKMAAMGQLAAGISHELNQPLTGIKGFAQTTLMDLDKKSPLRDDLNRIVEQADRMDKIIRHVRMFARKTEFEMKEIDINTPIDDALMLLKTQLNIHNIEVNKSLSKYLPKIRGDTNQLEQVFINLINNARDSIDSLKDPKHQREIIIQNALSNDEKSIEVTLKDTGCGISKENLNNIFNPFFTTKSPDGGTGLGLSIVYRIIEDHKGSLKVESEVGKGTTFKITLPVA